MSGRKNTFAYKIAAAQSLATSFYTDPINLNSVSLVGYHVSTASVTNNVGEFGLQKRIWVDVNNYSDWNDMTLSSTNILADVNAIFEMIASTMNPGQIRMKYSALDAQIQTLTFPALADADDGDYIVITDKNDVVWAIALDTTGAAAAEPTGSVWGSIAASHKDYVDISGATTAASVAALIETALNALSGFISVFTTNDTAADGTMTLSSTAAGFGVAPASYNADDSNTGSITGVITSGPDGTAAIFVSGAQE